MHSRCPSSAAVHVAACDALRLLEPPLGGRQERVHSLRYPDGKLRLRAGSPHSWRQSPGSGPGVSPRQLQPWPPSSTSRARASPATGLPGTHPDPREPEDGLTSQRRPPPPPAPLRSRPRPPAVPTRPFVVPKAAAAGSSSPCWGRSWTYGASHGGCPRSSFRACRPAAGAPPTPPSRPAGPWTTAPPMGARGLPAGGEVTGLP